MRHSSDQKERRGHLRIAVSIPVIYAFSGCDAKLAVICNIACSGVQLATVEDAPLPTTVLMRFIIPGELQSVTVRGQVVGCYYDATAKRFMYGVAFIQIRHADRNRLSAFVREESGQRRAS